MKTGIIASIASIVMLAVVTANADNRLWNPADETNKNLADGANWDPAFTFGTDDISADVLTMNSTTNATLATDFSTKTLFVGGNGAALGYNSGNDRGAQLDISAGTLSLTDTLWVGGGYADNYDCILNLTGTGKVNAYQLRTGDCASNNGKANYINVGPGTEVTVEDQTWLSTYNGGTTYVNINGGTWENVKALHIGSSGDAVFTLNSGTVNLSTSPDNGEAIIGSGSKLGKLVVNGGEFNSMTLHIGRDGHEGLAEFNGGVSVISNYVYNWYGSLNLGWGANSKGTMRVSGDADVSIYGPTLIGRSGNATGILEVSGGKMTVMDQDLSIAADTDSTGIVVMTGGELSGNNVIVGSHGTADVEVSGGTFKSRYELRIGDYAYNESAEQAAERGAGVGTLTLRAGGTVQVGTDANWANLYVGNSGTGKFVYDGGTFVNNGNLVIGRNTGSTGVVEVVSGTLQAAGNDIYVGNQGTGILTVDGGMISCKHWCDFNRSNNDTKNEEGEVVAVATPTEGSAINLNKGGTLNVGVIHNTGKGRSTFNWNGGVFKPFVREDGGYYEYIFEDVDKYDVNVLRHGAIVDTDGKNRSINVALTGDGNFVLRGGSTCWIKKASDLRRGVRVESGSLVFEQGFVTATTETTPIKEIYVAEGQSLDLKGNVEKPTIYVQSYTRNGVVQEPGTYDDYGATIIVIASGNTVATATWTNSDGDGDFSNPDNWECYNADGVLLFDAVPPAATTATLTIPYGGSSLVEFHAIQAEYPGATCVLAVSGSQKLEVAPDVMHDAIAWYDFADVSTVATNGVGEALSVANRGTAGASLDGIAYKDAGHDACNRSFYGEATLGGRNLLSLKKTYGFVTQNGAGIEGNADRSLLVLYRDKRNVYPNSYVQDEQGNDTEEVKDWYSEIFPLGIEKVDGHWSGDGQFRIEDQAWRYVMSYQGGALLPSYVWLQEPDWRFTTMTSHDDGESIKVNGNAWRPEVNEFAAAEEQTAENLATPADYRIFMGLRRQYESPSAGEIAEAMVFDKTLTTDEYASVTNYIAAKWFGASTEGLMLPGDVALAEGATLDLDGYTVAFDSVSGSGTIANGTVTAIGTLNIVVNADGTANKVVIPNGIDVTGMKVNITGIRNLKLDQPAVVLEAATGAIAGSVASVDVTTDIEGFRCRVKVNADGKLELSKSSGFSLIVR